MGHRTRLRFHAKRILIGKGIGSQNGFVGAGILADEIAIKVAIITRKPFGNDFEDTGFLLRSIFSFLGVEGAKGVPAVFVPRFIGKGFSWPTSLLFANQKPGLTLWLAGSE